MIYEIAQWLRARHYDISSYDLKGNLTLGFMILFLGFLTFLISSSHLSIFEAALVGVFTGGLFGFFITTLAIPRKPNFKFSLLTAGGLLGVIIATGLFAILPYVFGLNALAILAIVISTIVLAEIVFLKYDDTEPSPGQRHFWFTAERKICALFKSLAGVLAAIGVFKGTKGLVAWAQANWAALKEFFGVVGIAVVIIAAIYVYIKLNSLKYRANGQHPAPPTEQSENTETRKRTRRRK